MFRLVTPPPGFQTMVVTKFEPTPDSDSEEIPPVSIASGWIPIMMGVPAGFTVSSDTPTTETDDDVPPPLESPPFYEVRCGATGVKKTSVT